MTCTITADRDAWRGAVTDEWEAFCDHSYYDLWCVRKVGDRTFGRGFHVMRQDEADALRDLLNTRAQAEASRKAREDALVEALAMYHAWSTCTPAEIEARFPGWPRDEGVSFVDKNARDLLARAHTATDAGGEQS